jgi:uncharacterized cupredoxin-like copper-binding protein
MVTRTTEARPPVALSAPTRRTHPSRTALAAAASASVVAAVAIAALAWPGGPVLAHGPQGHAAAGGPVVKEQKDWGIAGDAKAVRRTIVVRMGDDMRFQPARIEVRKGETVRFRVHNDGRLMHEFVIGTRSELEEHARLMEKFPDMQHDEPYMAHVDPGKAGEIVWHFNRAGEFLFGCLVAGHYPAGMVGTLKVVAR